MFYDAVVAALIFVEKLSYLTQVFDLYRYNDFILPTLGKFLNIFELE